MKNKILSLIVLCSIAFTGCNDFLEENPQSFVTSENFYNNKEEAAIVLSGVYDALGTKKSWGLYSANMMIAETGSTVSTSKHPNPAMSGPANYISMPEHKTVKEIWQFSYVAINRANAFIDNVEKMDKLQIDATTQKRFIGEAKFIRAISYFNLVRLYGGVPLILNNRTDMNELMVERNSIESVYNSIISDLIYAKENLYHKSGSTFPATYGASDNGRATVEAATGLLGKVYLTAASSKRHGQFSEAWNTVAVNSYEWVNDADMYEKSRAELKQIIDWADAGEANVAIVNDYSSLFLESNENNKESLFEMQFGPSTEEPSRFVIWSGIHTTGPKDVKEFGYGRVGPHATFTESYAQNYTAAHKLDKPNTDFRFYWNIGVFKWNKKKAEYYNNPFEFTYRKFRTSATGAVFDGTTNFPVLRYADVLLMYAEALNELNGDINEVAQYVNVIRARARKGGNTDGMLGGISDVDYPASTQPADVAPVDQTQMREIIYQERKWELCYEGHARFDDVRMGKLVPVIKEFKEYLDFTDVLAETPGVTDFKEFNKKTDDFYSLKSRGMVVLTETPAISSVYIVDANNFWPIPTYERNLNGNLLQNDGY